MKPLASKLLVHARTLKAVRCHVKQATYLPGDRHYPAKSQFSDFVASTRQRHLDLQQSQAFKHAAELFFGEAHPSSHCYWILHAETLVLHFSSYQIGFLQPPQCPSCFAQVGSHGPLNLELRDSFPASIQAGTCSQGRSLRGC